MHRLDRIAFENERRSRRQKLKFKKEFISFDTYWNRNRRLMRNLHRGLLITSLQVKHLEFCRDFSALLHYYGYDLERFVPN